MSVADLAEDQPYESDTFDFIFCNGVLGYIDSNKPLQHLLRVLAPGGRMVLCFRHAHFVERRYQDAITGATLIRKSLFDPYPENDAYTHDYVCATIEKDSLKRRIVIE